MQDNKYERSPSAEDRSRNEQILYTSQNYDGNLNFATAPYSEDEMDYKPDYKKSKMSRQDPLSHRIIEKRRRDRMNNCLADLSHLIPTDYLKKGRGRIEKTEIIEMAIKYIKHLQQDRSTPSDEISLNKSYNNNSYEFPNEAYTNRCSKRDSNRPASYKYKTNIKLRFSQDVNCGSTNEDRCDGEPHENVRRTSITSIDSSGHSSTTSSIGEVSLKNLPQSTSPFEPIQLTPYSYKNINDLAITSKNEHEADSKTSNFNVPIFVLHTKGAFYVPLTIDYYTLMPFLQNYSIVDIETNLASLILHPVTINVNFQHNKQKM